MFKKKFLASCVATVVAITVNAEQKVVSPEQSHLEEEILIVTVERREMLLHKFAGTAASISAEELAIQSVNSLESLGKMVPGLQIGMQEGSVEVYLRGVGNNNNSEIGDPTVATHLDGSYVARPYGLNSYFHDIERVEINVGPQGTIRGRNATAGTINVLSNKPDTEELTATLETEIGSYGKKSFSGVLNLPFADTAAFRLSGVTAEQDSYFDNKGLNQDVDLPGASDTQGLRAQFLYEPTKDFSLLVGLDHNSESGTGYGSVRFASAISNYGTGLGNDFDSGLTAHPIETLEPFDMVWAARESPSEDTTHNGIRVELEYAIHSSLDVELNLSSRDLDNRVDTFLASNVFWEEQDISLDAFSDQHDRYVWDRRSDSDSAELRFIGEGDLYYWSAGVFMFQEDQATLLASTDDYALTYWGQEYNNRMTTESTAVYFDGTVDLTDDLALTLGLRHTTEEKERVGAAYRLDFFGLPGEFQNAANNRYGLPGWSLAQGLNRTLVGSDVNDDGIVNGDDFTSEELLALWTDGVNFSEDDNVPVNVAGLRPTYVHQSGAAKYDFTDFRLRLAWEYAENSLAYASVSTGHKSGGFNDQLFPAEEVDAAIESGALNLSNTISYENGLFIYEPESLTAFELGIKRTYEDGYFNASVFKYDYSDQQFSSLTTRGNLAGALGAQGGSFSPVGGGDILFTYNIPESTIDGLSIEGSIELPAGFSATFNALYLKSEVASDAFVADSRFGYGSLFSGNDQNTIDWDFDGDGTLEGANETLVTNVKGNSLPKAPELAINVTLAQEITFGAGAIGWLASVHFQDDHYLTIFNGEGLNEATGEKSVGLYDLQKASSTVDLGLYYTTRKERLRLEVFGNNVTDERVATSQLQSPYALDRFYQSPRTFGVRAKVNF